jgi:RNAse (barnase) inhibitor barstar
MALRQETCPPDVYLLDDERWTGLARREAFPAAWTVAILDEDGASTREGFFTAIASALSFPAYFGRNWDAVYDCLTDLTWLPGTNVVLAVAGADRFAHQEPVQWQIAVKVLRDAVDFWRPLGRHLYVFLRGSPAVAPDARPAPTSCEWDDASSQASHGRSS